MKTLRKYVVAGAIYEGETGPEAQVGDTVKMFLDTEAQPGFPEFIYGIIQHPIVSVNCDTAKSYSIEYDEADLLGAVAHLIVDDVISVTLTPAFAALIEAEVAARIAGDAAVTDAFIAADVVVTDAFSAADLVLQGNIDDEEAARIAADAGKAALIHTHVSADITDATPAATANTVVKRDADIGANFKIVRLANFLDPSQLVELTSVATALLVSRFSALGALLGAIRFDLGSSGYTASFGMNNVTGDRLYENPNADGTLALTANASGIPDSITVAGALTALGIPTYADLATANAALGVGEPYYDTALAKLQITTA